MSQSQLSKRWFHKFIDRLMPGNCRKSLEHAFEQNSAACADLIKFISTNEHEVIAALKNDRRTKIRSIGHD